TTMPQTRAPSVSTNIILLVKSIITITKSRITTASRHSL
ncbi:hypothetical protein A6V00_25910, partial [Escherichia coli]